MDTSLLALLYYVLDFLTQAVVPVESQNLLNDFQYMYDLKTTKSPKLGDNYIQIFHLGWYIVGNMVGKFVLRCVAVKHDFCSYI